MMSAGNWERRLADLGQSHLLAECSSTDTIIEQLNKIDSSYPGGISGYVGNAKKLLTASRNNEDAFEGFVPSMPPTINIDLTDVPALLKMESEAREALHQLGFVLVAGGLGERLGYSDIKVKLFTQVTEEMSYMEYYCKCILRCQRTAETIQGKPCTLPLFIMTSGDTHDRTVTYLEQNDYFGLMKSQVYVRQQEKVPALEHSDARIALSMDKSRIETKPHGHGDVHMILHSQGLLEEFSNKYGVQWLFFFQDTNALAFRALQILLATSMRNNLTMNSLAIPRLPGENVGGICKLTPITKAGGQSPSTAATGDGRQQPIVLNVEYNQLDGMLQAAGTEGDVAFDATGFSQYPGNCNILLFKMSEYKRVLERSGGIVPEFVNPKYQDATRTTFKSPTRIECMMQEIPRMFSPDQTHGCTVIARLFCFSTVKNCCDDASKRVTPECAFSAEQDLYHNSRRCLEMALGHTNVHTDPPRDAVFNGVKYEEHCRIWISPESAVGILDMQDRLKEANISSVKVTHDTALFMTPSCGVITKTVPRPVPLTSQEMSDPSFPDNYKVRGYRPAF